MLGDVCGKGLEAAKAASLARHTIGTVAMQRMDPAGVLSVLNETFSARRGASDLFLTAIYGTFAMRGERCVMSLASAGHAPPIVRRPAGSAEALDLGGPLIGVFPSLAIETLDVSLEPGDALIVYTDGVSEARRDQALFGDEAVRRIIASADASADAATLARSIEEAALAFGRGTACDDIAILVLRVPLSAGVHAAPVSLLHSLY